MPHGNELGCQPARVLCRKCPLMTGTGVCVHRFSTQPITPREVVGGGDHVHPGSRVVQGFPEKILELHLRAKAETASMGIGRNRIARHRFGGHAQGQLHAVIQLPGGLAQQFETGGADPLHPQCRNRLRHAAVEADVPWQHVGIETGLGHGTRQHAVDCQRVNLRARQYFAPDLDAQVDRRHLGQCPAEVHPRCAHRIENRRIGKGRVLPAGVQDFAHDFAPARRMAGSSPRYSASTCSARHCNTAR
ncbi:hypothetical protein D3C84_569980 [compost metagenome]